MAVHYSLPSLLRARGDSEICSSRAALKCASCGIKESWFCFFPCPAGRTCSENVNDCWLQPCLNGGSCMDLINDYICHCPLGKQRALATRLQKYHAINFSAGASLGICEDVVAHVLTCKPPCLLLIIFQCWRETSKDGNREDCSFETLKAEPRPLKATKQKQISELGRNKHNFLSQTRAQCQRETFNNTISIDNAYWLRHSRAFHTCWCGFCPLVVNYTNACCLHKTKRCNLPTWHCEFNVTFISRREPRPAEPSTNQYLTIATHTEVKTVFSTRVHQLWDVSWPTQKKHVCLFERPFKGKHTPINLPEARWAASAHITCYMQGFYSIHAAAHPSLLIICSYCCLLCSLLPPALIRFEQNQDTNVSVRLPFTVRLHWQIYRQVFLLSLYLPSNLITALFGLPAFTKQEQKNSTVLV